MTRKEEYDFFKSIGICVRCHKNSAEPNKVMCLECAGRDADRYRVKGRSETTLQKDAVRKKKHYEKCKLQGICPKCGRTTDRHVFCKICRSKIRNHKERNRTDIGRSEWISYGICYLCGKAPAMDGKKVCSKCYETRLKAINKCVSESQKKEKGVLCK